MQSNQGLRHVGAWLAAAGMQVDRSAVPGQPGSHPCQSDPAVSPLAGQCAPVSNGLLLRLPSGPP